LGKLLQVKQRKIDVTTANESSNRYIKESGEQKFKIHYMNAQKQATQAQAQAPAAGTDIGILERNFS
jgi:hypothetical protein